MNKAYAPTRMYVKVTREAALAIGAIAQSQDGELQDPRRVVWSIVEEYLFERGAIAEMSLPAVEWPGGNE